MNRINIDVNRRALGWSAHVYIDGTVYGQDGFGNWGRAMDWSSAILLHHIEGGGE